MQSGRLKHVIKFQEATKTRDDYGAESIAWNTVLTVKADVFYKSGTKGVQDGAVFSSQNIDVSMRFNSMVKETMRIEFNWLLYRITFINPVVVRRELKLTMERIQE